MRALVEATRECARVLKPTGSMFVNLGDRRIGKTLVGLPWRYALQVKDELSLLLRAELIWAKPNPMPEPTVDRVRTAHETWFHFTLNPHYFHGVDEFKVDGRWPTTVWKVTPEPLRVPQGMTEHFAAMPQEWVRRIVLGWSPTAICTRCDGAYVPQVERIFTGQPDPEAAANVNQRKRSTSTGGTTTSTLHDTESVTRKIIGYACQCSDRLFTAPARPAIVLDPFVGSGTTVGVANTLGRYGIGVDLSTDYLRLATWRARAGQFRRSASRMWADRQGVLL